MDALHAGQHLLGCRGAVLLLLLLPQLLLLLPQLLPLLRHRRGSVQTQCPSAPTARAPPSLPSTSRKQTGARRCPR